MPYITSSIVIQLLNDRHPKLTQWRDQGAVGQKKITQTTRYSPSDWRCCSDRSDLRFHGHTTRPCRLQHRPDPKFTSIWMFMSRS